MKVFMSPLVLNSKLDLDSCQDDSDLGILLFFYYFIDMSTLSPTVVLCKLIMTKIDVHCLD